ncbi:MAG: pteridine reductase [Pseudomonadales bacterium]|nr:pteridine reductase [Pseudomonadales bacterium]
MSDGPSAPVALVTGGALRIGAAITTTLHDAGFAVVVHCRRSRAEAEALVARLCLRRPGSAWVVEGDLATEDGPERIASACLALGGRCDLLVNNASSFFPTPLGHMDAEAWADLLGSNLRGPLFLAQALAEALRTARGAIVNLVDVHADRPLPGYPLYSVAKAGLAMATRSLALELAPEVRVNGVSPGAILWPEDPGWDERRAAMLSRIPLGRIGAPEDVARAVLYLARAPYVTGQLLAVDGGLALG